MAALKAILAKIDEVDEKYRDLYTQDGDKWKLTGIEGVKTQKDVDTVMESLRKEREAHAKTKTDLTAANSKVQAWDDLEPEDVKAKLEKLATLETGNSVPELAKNFETTVNARVAAVVDGKVKAETTKLQRTIDTLTTENTTAKQTIGTYETKDQQRTIHDAVRQVAVNAKVRPEAVGDLLVLATGDFKLVDGKVQTEDGRDPTAWLDDRKAKTPYLWPTAQGTGATGSDGLPITGDNPFGRASHNLTKISQLVQRDPTSAAKLAGQAGVPKDAAGNFRWHEMPPEKK